MSQQSGRAANPLLHALVSTVVERHRDTKGPLLPVLHDIQAALGYVDPGCLQPIADALNLSRAEVYGVVTFYQDFRDTPPGEVVVRICRAEACQAVGADALVDHARATWGMEIGATSADGAVTVEQVFCLGNCALGPSVQVAGRLHGRITAQRLNELVRASA